MAHARAKLTPMGRAALVERVLVGGWPVARAAEAMNVSRATAHKWIRRFHEEGPSGLFDRTSRPQRCPHALPPGQVHRILEARCRPRSATADPPTPTGWDASELLDVDVDELTGALPLVASDDPGRGTDRQRRLGYDFVHAAVDDHSRLAYLEVHPDERSATTAAFLRRAGGFFASHGVRIERVMTDNAWSYRRSPPFLAAVANWGPSTC